MFSIDMQNRFLYTSTVKKQCLSRFLPDLDLDINRSITTSSVLEFILALG